MTITLRCNQLEYIDYLTCFSVKIMLAKKKERTSSLLFDDYLHSWYVVYTVIKNISLQSSLKVQLYTKKIYDPHTLLIQQNLPMVK